MINCDWEKVDFEKAREAAKTRDEPVAVVEMDNGEQRKTSIVPVSYTDHDEFKAFDGKIIVIVHPDGDID